LIQSTALSFSNRGQSRRPLVARRSGRWPDAGAKAIHARPCRKRHEPHVLQQILMRDYRLA